MKDLAEGEGGGFSSPPKKRRSSSEGLESFLGFALSTKLGMGDGRGGACESEIDAGGLRAPAMLLDPGELCGSGSRNRLKRETLFPRKVRLRGVFGGCSGAWGPAWGPAGTSSAAAMIAVAALGPLSEYALQRIRQSINHLKLEAPPQL